MKLLETLKLGKTINPTEVINLFTLRLASFNLRKSSKCTLGSLKYKHFSTFCKYARISNNCLKRQWLSSYECATHKSSIFRNHQSPFSYISFRYNNFVFQRLLAASICKHESSFCKQENFQLFAVYR